jgi:hypothetical protein
VRPEDRLARLLTGLDRLPRGVRRLLAVLLSLLLFGVLVDSVMLAASPQRPAHRSSSSDAARAQRSSGGDCRRHAIALAGFCAAIWRTRTGIGGSRRSVTPIPCCCGRLRISGSRRPPASGSRGSWRCICGSRRPVWRWPPRRSPTAAAFATRSSSISSGGRAAGWSRGWPTDPESRRAGRGGTRDTERLVFGMALALLFAVVVLMAVIASLIGQRQGVRSRQGSTPACTQARSPFATADTSAWRDRVRWRRRRGGLRPPRE